VRSEALAALAAALAGCTFADVTRPIGVISDGLSPVDAANLVEAAQCWNLEFGTQLVTGPEAARLDQQVVVFYDRATCLIGIAQTQDGWPHSIALCPERYWSGLEPSSPYGRPGPVEDLSPPPFRVLSHELGHLLNIVGHPGDPFAVMVGGGYPHEDMFRPIDRQWFASANTGFTPHRQCDRVIRSMAAGTDGRVGHCACDNSRGPDPARPLSFVIDAGFEDGKAVALANAAQCWNLRYGTALSVQSPELDDPVVHVDPSTLTCLINTGLFLSDRGGGLLCSPTQAAISADFYPRQQRYDIGQVFGVLVRGDADTAFLDADDARFESLYPGMPIRCHQLHADPVTGACSCEDLP